MSETYSCAACHGVFETGRTEGDAEAELDALFPGVPKDECDVVCDDCFNAMAKEFGWPIVVGEGASVTIEPYDRGVS